jgi:hypothetical protein
VHDRAGRQLHPIAKPREAFSPVLDEPKFRTLERSDGNMEPRSHEFHVLWIRPKKEHAQHELLEAFFEFLLLLQMRPFNSGAAKVAPNIGDDERRRAIVCLELRHLLVKGHGLLLAKLNTTVLQASPHQIYRRQDKLVVVVVSVVVHGALLQYLVFVVMMMVMVVAIML